MSSLTSEQIERWKEYLAQEQADAAFTAERAGIEATRERVRPEIQAFIAQFLDGRSTIEEFRATFQAKTQRDWPFGVGGFSGAMVVNTLVKHLPEHQPEVTDQLRQAIRVPATVEDGKRALRGFYDFLENYINTGAISKTHLQLGHVPFLVSFFWYIQNQETWPVYYPSARQALIKEKLFKQTNDPVTDYFAFRQAFFEVASAVRLDTVEMATLAYWVAERREKPPLLPKATEQPVGVIVAEPEEVAVGEQAATTHTHIQWLLAKIGQKFGLRVWIAANDQGKEWDGQRLGDLSVKSLPTLGMDPDTQRIISLIDVVWLKGTNQVVAAFEVEHTTSIYSGLLRMSDLVVLSPNLNFPLYIVAPASRMSDVRRQLSRPTFQALELNRRCGFFAGEDLVKESESILRWASDPSSIDRLVSRVGDVTGTEYSE